MAYINNLLNKTKMSLAWRRSVNSPAPAKEVTFISRWYMRLAMGLPDARGVSVYRVCVGYQRLFLIWNSGANLWFNAN